MTPKTQMRQEYLIKRKKLTDKEKEEKSKEIQKKLFSADAYKNAKTVMFYISLDDEVITSEMIINALKDKKVLVPRTILKDKCMEAVEITKKTEFKENKLKIPEPVDGKIFSKEKIDLVIIPAVAFDFWGHRIGYGQGYYDRFCKGMKSTKIGLAYDVQLTEKIPAESHDVKADLVITEKRTLKYDNDD